MNNQQLTPEQNYQVLLDALKYTSDIVVTLTEKNTLNENKITNEEKKNNSHENKILILEKIVQEQKNMINKNTKIIEEFGKKILQVEKNITLLIKNNSKSNTDFVSKTINSKNSNTNTNTNSKIELDTEFDTELNNELNSNSNSDIFDLETINNTINNTNILSDVTSFNLEEIENFKKQKTATSLVENLIKRKQELENKINDLTSNPDKSQNSKNSQNSQNSQKSSNSLIKSFEDDKEEKDSKTFDINAIRRKKNFARKF